MNHKNIIIIYDNFDSNESFEQILSLDTQDHVDIVCHEKKLDEATRLLKPGSLIFSFTSFVYDEIETQVEKILLIRKKIDAVTISSRKESLVCIASRLREKLDLKHGLLPKTANLFVDKYLMKNSVLDNASVRTSKMLLVDSNTKNIILDSLTLPVVLKPRRETGSVGVSILKSISDLNILDDLAGKDYLVENYIDGETYRVDGVIYEGEIQELFIFRDTPSCFDYYQYRVPQVEFLISDPIISQQAHSVTNQILNHLNYNSGVFHLELIRDSHGQFHFLEVAARPGGGAARKALKKHFNIDLAIQMMRIDAGLPIRRKQNHEESAIAVLMIPTPSRTKKYRINSILSPKAPAGVALALEYPANGTQLGEYDSVNIYISAKYDDLVISTLSSIDPSEIAKFSEWTENEPYN